MLNGHPRERERDTAARSAWGGGGFLRVHPLVAASKQASKQESERERERDTSQVSAGARRQPDEPHHELCLRPMSAEPSEMLRPKARQYPDFAEVPHPGLFGIQYDPLSCLVPISAVNASMNEMHGLPVA